MRVAIVLFLTGNFVAFGCILYTLSNNRYGFTSPAIAVSLLSILAIIEVVLAYWACQSQHTGLPAIKQSKQQVKFQERRVFDLIPLPAYWINSELKILAVNQRLAQTQSLQYRQRTI